MIGARSGKANKSCTVRLNQGKAWGDGSTLAIHRGRKMK